jgi:uncharacterized integral membrane protein (TIGR00697 family)
MNETIFFIHLLIVSLFALGALRLGKEALIVWIAVQALLANLFVLKQMVFFSFHVTCSDVFAIGSILGLNLLQEYHGKAIARKTSYICFYFMLFFAAMSYVHLLYHPSPEDTAHAAYATLLSPAPRLLFASLGVFFLVQQLDVRLFGALRNRLPLILRNGISLALSQLIDTILFTYLGLYGLVSSPFDIILISFLIKCAILLCLSPVTLLSKRLLRV